MNGLFYLSAGVAIISTALVITRMNAIHALLYLVVSLLSVAMVFYSLGAAFVAALEVIVYAGAIMVLFVFVMMMLNLGQESEKIESQWLHPRAWEGPAILATILIAELLYVLASDGLQPLKTVLQSPQQVGIALYGPYLLGVELASMLLLSGLVGAYHLGRRDPSEMVKGGED